MGSNDFKIGLSIACAIFFLGMLVYFISSASKESEMADFSGVKVVSAGAPFNFISSKALPDDLAGKPIKPPVLSKIAIKDPSGDGSGVGTIGGGPLTSDLIDTCDCRWLQSNTSDAAFLVASEGKQKHGLCYVSHNGNALFGDLDPIHNTCLVNISGKAVKSTVFHYLSGTGCETPMLKRYLCSGEQDDIRMDHGKTGICLVDKTFIGGKTESTFGYIMSRNGHLKCMTVSRVSEPESICSGFKYLPIEGAYCMPPPTRP